MNTIVGLGLFSIGWLALGWLGARLALIDWHRTFGDYDAIGPAAFTTLLGPIGLIVGLLQWLLGLPKKGRRTSAKFWGLR
jgi:hypothetical protein